MIWHSRLRLLRLLITSTILSNVVADNLFGPFSPLESPIKRVLEHTLAQQPTTECTKLRLTGPIETTSCDYEKLERVNDDLFSRLRELVETPFFRYFKVDLYRDCPFWQDNGFCMQRECGVTSVDESEIPEKWRAATLSKVHTKDDSIVRLPGCYYNLSDYCFLDDGDEGEYIDLADNPETFTGYSGERAHRVWNAIYDENCFGLSELTANAAHTSSRYDQSPTTTVMLESGISKEDCLEKKVYYRVISGLHASISTHICHQDLDKRTGVWGPNLDCFAERIAQHPERLQNIYFNTVLLLRAVARVGPYLSAYNIDTEHEPQTNALLKEVIELAKIAGAFDEKSLFRGNDAKVLKEEFKNAFRNVSRIMDCVGCDKCRLWGKVQFTGMAAAMKILFEMDENALNPQMNSNLLSRWEVVALINVLHRMSESLHVTEDFRKMWNRRKSEREDIRTLNIPTITTVDPTNPSISVILPPRIHYPDRPVLSNIQDLSKAVLTACRRGTIRCLNVVSGFAHAIIQTTKVLFTDRNAGEARGSSADL